MISKDKVADFCQRHHIRWLALFGSALRDDFGPESDVDVVWTTVTDDLPQLIAQLEKTQA